MHTNVIFALPNGIAAEIQVVLVLAVWQRAFVSLDDFNHEVLTIGVAISQKGSRRRTWLLTLNWGVIRL